MCMALRTVDALWAVSTGLPGWPGSPALSNLVRSHRDSLLLAVQSTVPVPEVTHFLYCHSRVFGLFSLLLCLTRFWTHCMRLRPCSTDVASTVDFLGFLRLVRPNLSPHPLPLLTVVAPLPWCLGRSLKCLQPSPLPLPLWVGGGWAGKVRRPFRRPPVASAYSGGFRQGAGLRFS